MSSLAAELARQPNFSELSFVPNSSRDSQHLHPLSKLVSTKLVSTRRPSTSPSTDTDQFIARACRGGRDCEAACRDARTCCRWANWCRPTSQFSSMSQHVIDHTCAQILISLQQPLQLCASTEWTTDRSTLSCSWLAEWLAGLPASDQDEPPSALCSCSPSCSVRVMLPRPFDG